MSYDPNRTKSNNVFLLARLEPEEFARSYGTTTPSYTNRNKLRAEHAKFYFTDQNKLRCIHAYYTENYYIKVEITTKNLDKANPNDPNTDEELYKKICNDIENPTPETKKKISLPAHSILWYMTSDDNIKFEDGITTTNEKYNRYKNNCLTYLRKKIFPKFNIHIPERYFKLYGITIPSRLIQDKDNPTIWRARLPSDIVFRLSTHLVPDNMKQLLSTEEYLKELQDHPSLQRQVILYLNKNYDKTEIAEMAQTKENIDLLLNINKKETKRLKQKIQQLKKQIQKSKNEAQKIKNKIKKITKRLNFETVKARYHNPPEQNNAFPAILNITEKVKPLKEKLEKQKLHSDKKSEELKQHLQFFIHKDKFEILGVLRKKKFLRMRSMQDECRRFAELQKQANIHENFDRLVRVAIHKNSPALTQYILTTGGSKLTRFLRPKSKKYLSDDLTAKDLLKLVEKFKNDKKVMDDIFKKRSIFGGRDFWKLFKTAEHFSKLAEYAKESDYLRQILSNHSGVKKNMYKAAQKLLKNQQAENLSTITDEQIIQNHKYLFNILENKTFYDTILSHCGKFCLELVHENLGGKFRTISNNPEDATLLTEQDENCNTTTNVIVKILDKPNSEKIIEDEFLDQLEKETKKGENETQKLNKEIAALKPVSNNIENIPADQLKKRNNKKPYTENDDYKNILTGTV